MTFEHVSYPFLVVHSPHLHVFLHFSWKSGANSSRLNGDDLKHLRNSEIIWQPGSWMLRMIESQGNWRIMWYWNVPFLLKGVLGLPGADLGSPYRVKGRQSIGSGPPSRAAPFPEIWLSKSWSGQGTEPQPINLQPLFAPGCVNQEDIVISSSKFILNSAQKR